MTTHGFCPSDDEMKTERAALSLEDRATLDALPQPEDSEKETDTQALLDAAATAQTAYWDALRKLEEAICVDLDDVGELSGLTVQDVIDSFGPDGFGGVDDD